METTVFQISFLTKTDWVCRLGELGVADVWWDLVATWSLIGPRKRLERLFLKNMVCRTIIQKYYYRLLYDLVS